MTLIEAKILRDKGIILIGKNAKGLDCKIIDVIVIPSENASYFFDEYRKYSDVISNDKMILKYPSKAYAVRVILDYNIDSDVIAEDISTYKDLIS